ncbi:ribokinase [Petrotoga sp. HWH.PT.55.6.1]|uniref:ribokinase n=1 Tax=unclassified Petrotoga TaxID=2620614 RepID=UPI000CA04DD8|nr:MULTISPECIES: ribokinase [unclassified Petrotoga]PNR90732.1 ribokinase [Petrotoga sp. HWHPT.55.6.3]RPD35968.1 ribokinase [Petrotoga sp. HWH.PT.55.6.1]
MNKVTVFGSYVMDLTVFSPHIPVVGETVFSGPFRMGPGGKGFNQAVACKKAGAEVEFMTKIGQDFFAPFVKNSFDRFNISKEYLLESPTAATGVALIIVEEQTGKNAIAVATGACEELSPKDVQKSREIFMGSDVFLAQFEANLKATYEAIKLAKELGAKVLLNPAPVREFDHTILKYVDIIILNEIEASLMTNIPLEETSFNRDISNIGTELNKLVKTVIITLGERGVYCPSIKNEIIPAYNVKTIDTTGAGDAFAGIFASYLSRGNTLEESIYYAMAGAALSTMKFGTSPSMPSKEEIELFLNNRRNRIF